MHPHCCISLHSSLKSQFSIANSCTRHAYLCVASCVCSHDDAELLGCGCSNGIDISCCCCSSGNECSVCILSGNGEVSPALIHILINSNDCLAPILHEDYYEHSPPLFLVGMKWWPLPLLFLCSVAMGSQHQFTVTMSAKSLHPQ